MRLKRDWGGCNASDWIDELLRGQMRIDNAANRLDKSQHYVAPFQDSIVEIVAWGIAEGSLGAEIRIWL